MLPSRIVLACCVLSPALIDTAWAEELPDAGHEMPVAEVVDRPTHAPGSEHVHYAYAQVLNVQPVYEDVPVAHTIEHCQDYARLERHAPSDAGGAVLGAIIGGVIGNQIGSGSGRQAATVAGAAIGGAIGHEAGRDDEIVEERHCFTEQEYAIETQQVGYDVEYRYRGEVFVSRLDHHPGDRLRIRVAVSPAEAMDAALTSDAARY